MKMPVKFLPSDKVSGGKERKMFADSSLEDFDELDLGGLDDFDDLDTFDLDDEDDF